MPMGRRRRIRQSLFRTVQSLDQNDRFVLERCTGYLVRLLSRYPRTDSNTLALVQWVLKKDINKLEQFLLGHLNERQKAKTVKALDDVGDDREDYVVVLAKVLEQVSRKIQCKAIDCILDLLKEAASRSNSGRSQIEKGLGVIRKMFNLNDPEEFPGLPAQPR